MVKARHQVPASVLSGAKAILILSLLALSSLLVAVPVTQVSADTGSPSLGAVNSVVTPTSFTPSVSNVTVLLGTMYVTKIDTTAVDPDTNLLALNFSGVSFSAATFWLILSMGTETSNRTGDAQYSPKFSVADFCANAAGHFTALTNANGTFYIGWLGTGACSVSPTPAGVTPVVVGPIPVLATAAYKYIKVYDGSAVEAVAAQQLIISNSVTVATTTTATSVSTTTSLTTNSSTLTFVSPTTQFATITVTTVQAYTFTNTETVGPTVTSVSVLSETQTQLSTSTATVLSTSTQTTTTTVNSGSSSSMDVLYVVIVVVVVVALAAIAWLLLRRGRAGAAV